MTPEEADLAFQNLNSWARRWGLPILRAIHNLGGRAPVPAVRAELRRVLGSAVSDAQWHRVETRNSLGWTRFDLVTCGLMAKSERGVWALSEAGRAFVERTRDVPLESFSDVSAEAESEVRPQIATERVEATSIDAYEVPVLRALRGGPLQRARLLDVAVASIEDQLLPGDRRIGTPGLMVARYRSGWTLSKLKSKGEVRSPSAGLWELTAAGRQRLEAEEATWDFSKFPVGTATVRPEGAETGDLEPSVGVAPAGAERTFDSLAEVVEDRVFEALRLRLRPDLGPTPKDERVRVPRNVIFYGPPGTGKTFVAQEVARALTGSEAPEEGGRWSIVQFHPS